MFNRPPRIQRIASEHHIELIPPPQLPAKPKIDWLVVGLPVFAAGLGITLMIYFSGSTNSASYLMFLPFILASVVASALSHRRQKQEYKKLIADSIKIFRSELNEKKDKAQGFKAELLDLLSENYLSPLECSETIARKEKRIGERRPEDPDFLCVRAGLGNTISKIVVKGIPIENREPLYQDLYLESDEFVESAQIIEDAPIICNLREIGSLGVAAKVDDLRQFGWAFVIQVLTHHWPAEVNVAAFSSFVEVDNWKWLNNVQHKAKIFPNAVIEVRETEGVQQSLNTLEDEIRKRKATLVNMRAVGIEKEKSVKLPVLVLIFDRIADIYNHAAFALLLQEGKALGVYGIFLVDRVEDIPAECGGIVSIENQNISYETTGENNLSVKNIKQDLVRRDLLRLFSDNLRDIQWLIPEQVTEPPEQLRLLDLFPYVKLGDLPLKRWWGGDYPFGYLRTPIGKFSPTSDLVFDLNDSDTGHGPHGLIGGMTGSGKSELLKTLILSLALTHHPYDLNFALIDYKGGGAFDGFDQLPHVVGVITDIQNHADYATRVIQSLSWEVKRREHILAKARGLFALSNTHVDEYRKKLSVKIPVPRLVIIFDEYAEFQEKHPEESRKLINIARVGRSLGVHLILCTQNPMGRAVDQQVRDNSTFTICLKVKSPETSKALVNIPDAIQLRRGEAYFHVNGPQKFRVAYSGGAALTLDEQGSEIPSSSQSEAQALIKEINDQSISLKIPAPQKIWPEPLPDKITISDILSIKGDKPIWDGKEWNSQEWKPLSIPVGLLDDPQHQMQPIFNIDEHLLIFGPSGAGKSTLLLSAALCAGRFYSPEDLNIYCVDINGQSPLHYLEQGKMPHLPLKGGVIDGNDVERMNRLFKMVRAEISLRGGLFTDIRTYNSQESGAKSFPYILLMIDGIHSHYIQNNPGFKDQLDFIMRNGLSVGIIVILTGNLARDIPEALQADRNIVLLQSTDRSSILSLVGRAPETYQKKIDAGQEPNVGRGLINSIPPLEIQCGIPLNLERGGVDAIVGEFKEMGRSWHGDRPQDVEQLPNFIPLSSIEFGINEMITLGISQEGLEAIGMSISKDGPIFMITSMTSGSGKTSVLSLWLASLIKLYSPKELKLILVDYHTRTLSHFHGVPHLSLQDKLRSHVAKREDLKDVIDWLKEEVEKRRRELGELYSNDPEGFDLETFNRNLGYIVLVIDDYEAFINSDPPEFRKLVSAIVAGEEVGVRLIITEDVGLLGNDDLARRAKKIGCGVLLGGSDGLSIFNIMRPPHGQKTNNLSPGRGYVINRGVVQLMQAIAYWDREQEPALALKELVGASKSQDELLSI